MRSWRQKTDFCYLWTTIGGNAPLWSTVSFQGMMRVIYRWCYILTFIFPPIFFIFTLFDPDPKLMILIFWLGREQGFLKQHKLVLYVHYSPFNERMPKRNASMGTCSVSAGSHYAIFPCKKIDPKLCSKIVSKSCDSSTPKRFTLVTLSHNFSASG